MAGIYIHIPFCRQACHYCNFHFSTSMAMKGEMTQAIVKEIALRKSFFGQPPPSIETVYFGGGSPSVLTIPEIAAILDALSQAYDLSNVQEFTLEANPEDMTLDFLRDLSLLGFNRLSVGIQSFVDEELTYMNRIHTSHQSHIALAHAQEVGFEDFSIDLIYGSHLSTDQSWEHNLSTALSFDPNHISAYNLTIEDHTTFGNWHRKGKLSAIDDVKSSKQFDTMVALLSQHGYLHYEISNFAKHNHFALHNTNYWIGKPYIGLGPAAHSFIDNTRSWNIAHNAKYIKFIANDKLPLTSEQLTPIDKYNEFVMLGLRTMWGIDLDTLFLSTHVSPDHIHKSIDSEPWIKPFIINDNNRIKLTHEGKLFADKIAAALFLVD